MSRYRLLFLLLILLSGCSQTITTATSTVIPTASPTVILTPTLTITDQFHTKTNGTLYSGPDSVYFPSVGTLSPDDNVSISGRWGKYLKVNNSNLSGYISSELIDTTSTDSMEIDPLSVPQYNKMQIKDTGNIIANNDFLFSPDWHISSPLNSILLWEIQIPSVIPDGFGFVILNNSPLLSKDLWRTNSIILFPGKDRTIKLSIINGVKASAPNESLINTITLGSSPESGHILMMMQLENGTLLKITLCNADKQDEVFAVIDTKALNYSFLGDMQIDAYIALIGTTIESMQSALTLNSKSIPDGYHDNSPITPIQTQDTPAYFILNPEGTALVVQTNTGFIDIYDTFSWRKLIRFSTTNMSGGMDISSIGLLALATGDHSLAIFNVFDGSLRKIRMGRGNMQSDLCNARFDPTESFVGMVCNGGLVGLFRAEDGEDITFQPSSILWPSQMSSDLRAMTGSIPAGYQSKFVLQTSMDYQSWTTTFMTGYDYVIGIGDQGKVFATINRVKTSISIFTIENSRVNPTPISFILIPPSPQNDDTFIWSGVEFANNNSEFIVIMKYFKHVLISRYRIGDTKPFFSQSFPENGYSFGYAISRNRNAMVLYTVSGPMTFLSFTNPVSTKDVNLFQ